MQNGAIHLIRWQDQDTGESSYEFFDGASSHPAKDAVQLPPVSLTGGPAPKPFG
jgi:hypothetical protein